MQRLQQRVTGCRKARCRLLRRQPLADRRLREHRLKVAFSNRGSIFWLPEELGHGVLEGVLAQTMSRAGETKTYTSHELEDTVLCLIEEHSNFVQTLDHLLVLSDSPRHAPRECIAEVVVDVELAW